MSATRKIKNVHPTYEPNKWNKNKYIKQTHNCYAYALNLMDTKQANKCKKYIKMTKKRHCPRPQAGQYSGYVDAFNAKKVTCKRIEERMLKDNPFIQKLKNQKCPDGFYKIMLYVAKDGSDYHLFRQDNGGLWSHKDGWRLATNKDLQGRLIRNPEVADKKYTVYCGLYAVPTEDKYKHLLNIYPNEN